MLPKELYGASVDSQYKLFAWEIETLLTELFARRRKIGPRRTNIHSWQMISALFNELRNIENYEFRAPPDGLFRRDIARLFYRQLKWQSNNWIGAEYVRWWNIFDNPRLSEAFAARVGVELRTFLLLGLIWNTQFDTHWKMRILPIRSVPGISDRDVGLVLEALSAPVELIQRDAQDAIQSSSTTSYRRSPLRARPLVAVREHGRMHYIRPMEALLRWRLSSGLYYDVIGTQGVSNLIGEGFERHVRALLQAAYPDAEVKGDLQHGTKSRPRRTPDVLLVEKGVVRLAVECKATKVPLAVQTTIEDSKDRVRVVDEIAKGIKQSCEFAEQMRSGIAELSLAASPDIQSLVVVLDDIVMDAAMKPEVLAAARTKLEAAGSGHLADKVNNVVVCSVEEFEILLTKFDDVGVQGVLREAQSTEREAWMLTSVLLGHKSGRRNMPQSPLRSRLWELIDAKLEAVSLKPIIGSTSSAWLGN